MSLTELSEATEIETLFGFSVLQKKRLENRKLKRSAAAGGKSNSRDGSHQKKEI